MELSDEQWRERLSGEAFAVLRQGRTERGGSGPLLYHFAGSGVYRCSGCGAALFAAVAKYESGTGWPSFSRCLCDGVRLRDDPLHGMKRLEAVCTGCGGHLGHLFGDPESPTSERFCINSAALRYHGEGG